MNLEFMAAFKMTDEALNDGKTARDKMENTHSYTVIRQREKKENLQRINLPLLSRAS